METRLFNDPSLGRVFPAWHILESFSVEASRRPDFYPSAGPDLRHYDTSAVLIFATPPVYAYYSYKEGADGQALVQEVGVAEVRFLSRFPLLMQNRRVTCSVSQVNPVYSIIPELLFL